MENNNIIQQIKDFIENGKPSLEIGMDGRHWQLRREPIKGDLAAIYGTSSKTGKNGKFLAYTKGGCAFGSLRSVLGSEIEPNQDWFWDWKRFSNALTAQAIAIARAGGLDNAVVTQEGEVLDCAIPIFMTGKTPSYKYPDIKTFGTKRAAVIDEMPDLVAAAKVWLRQTIPDSYYKVQVRDIIMHRLVVEERARQVAQSWENDPSCDIYILRQIKRSIPERGRVVLDYMGYRGLVTVSVPQSAFTANVDISHVCCMVSWRDVIPAPKNFDELIRTLGIYGRVPNIKKASYRGKIIYQKP